MRGAAPLEIIGDPAATVRMNNEPARAGPESKPCGKIQGVFTGADSPRLR